MDFGTLGLNQPQQLDIPSGCNTEDSNNITNNNNNDIGLMTIVNDTSTTYLFQTVLPISKK